MNAGNTAVARLELPDHPFRKIHSGYVRYIWTQTLIVLWYSRQNPPRLCYIYVNPDIDCFVVP